MRSTQKPSAQISHLWLISISSMLRRGVFLINQIWHTRVVFMSVPDRSLAAFLGSSKALAQKWPGTHPEAVMLMHVLRISHPSLADALRTGLIHMITPPATGAGSRISLVHKSAIIVANARNEIGNTVLSPHTRPKQVTWIEILNLAVGGLNAIRMTG